MARELAQEVRNFIEQTNERFERTENSKKVLLKAIQKLSSNNNKNERLNSQRDHHSTHEENEPSPQSLVPQKTFISFISREEPIADNGTSTNSMEEITQMYASLDPNIQQLIPFKEYYESKLMENRKKHHVDEDL